MIGQHWQRPAQSAGLPRLTATMHISMRASSGGIFSSVRIRSASRPLPAPSNKSGLRWLSACAIPSIIRSFRMHSQARSTRNSNREPLLARAIFRLVSLLHRASRRFLRCWFRTTYRNSVLHLPEGSIFWLRPHGRPRGV